MSRGRKWTERKRFVLRPFTPVLCFIPARAEAHPKCMSPFCASTNTPNELSLTGVAPYDSHSLTAEEATGSDHQSCLISLNHTNTAEFHLMALPARYIDFQNTAKEREYALVNCIEMWKAVKLLYISGWKYCSFSSDCTHYGETILPCSEKIQLFCMLLFGCYVVARCSMLFSLLENVIIPAEAASSMSPHIWFTQRWCWWIIPKVKLCFSAERASLK